MWPSSGGGNSGWDYGPIDASQTSISFNTIAPGVSLAANTQYSWQVQAIDANGNQTSRQSSFTTMP